MGLYVEEFTRLYNQLDKQCRYHCRHLGHLKGLIENDDWMRVVENSSTGRILLLGNSEITNALVLFNTRMFDTQPDTVTIHKLARSLPTDREIERHHEARMEALGISYELEKYHAARARFVDVKRALKKNRTQGKLRALRDYALAHNIVPETEPERATINGLVELTEVVNELVDLAGYIINGSRSVYPGLSSKAEKETRMLYAVLPVLTTIEKN